MLSLLFGSPVFAGPPEGKGQGAEMSKTALTNHAGDTQAWDHASNANDNAAFMGIDDSTDNGSGDGDGTGDDGECTFNVITGLMENCG